MDVKKKSKSTFPISSTVSAKDFESPVLTRRASLQMLSKKQPSQNSQDKESSTKEHTPLKKQVEEEEEEDNVGLEGALDAQSGSSESEERPPMTEEELDVKIKEFGGI